MPAHETYCWRCEEIDVVLCVDPMTNDHIGVCAPCAVDRTIILAHAVQNGTAVVIDPAADWTRESH